MLRPTRPWPITGQLHIRNNAALFRSRTKAELKWKVWVSRSHSINCIFNGPPHLFKSIPHKRQQFALFAYIPQISSKPKKERKKKKPSFVRFFVISSTKWIFFGTHASQTKNYCRLEPFSARRRLSSTTISLTPTLSVACIYVAQRPYGKLNNLYYVQLFPSNSIYFTIFLRWHVRLKIVWIRRCQGICMRPCVHYERPKFLCSSESHIAHDNDDANTWQRPIKDTGAYETWWGYSHHCGGGFGRDVLRRNQNSSQSILLWFVPSRQGRFRATKIFANFSAAFDSPAKARNCQKLAKLNSCKESSQLSLTQFKRIWLIHEQRRNMVDLRLPRRNWIATKRGSPMMAGLQVSEGRVNRVPSKSVAVLGPAQVLCEYSISFFLWT